MASWGRLLGRLSFLHSRYQYAGRRTAVTTSTGAVLKKPVKYYNFGLLRVVAVMIPFVYVGYWVGGEFAEFLEKYEFYIPDEDEDD